MGFVDLLKERAKKSIKTIVLPETEDMRTIEATDKILKEGVAKIILIGNEEEINKKAAEGGFDISGATIVDPETSDKTQAYIDKFVELRAKKGMTPEKAKEILHTQYPYYGVMMVKMGDADGMVSGACHSTADTLRPCLQILKTKPGTKLVSAFFLIVVPDCEYGANGAFVFADSGLNQKVKQTFLYSLTLMQETSDTNLLSVLVKQKLTDLSHRESQNRSTTFPEDALQMISLVLLQLLLYSVRLRTNKIYISESYRIGEY